MSALPTGEAWAVGASRVLTNPPYGTEEFPMLLAFDGSAWLEQAFPFAGYYSNGARSVLSVVAARTPTDVWAAGGAMYPASWAGLSASAMVLHFDGSSWSQVTVPLPSALYIGLEVRAILPLAANDVWFGGMLVENATAQIKRPLLMHWNGAAMAVLPTPSLVGTSGPFLAGVKSLAALAPNDVYACCDVWNSGVAFRPIRSVRNVVLHWNGSAWSRLSIPDSTVLHQPIGMTVFGANDIRVFMNIDPQVAPHALQWNGSTWSNVAGVPFAQAVAASGPNDVHLGGLGVQHWDGTTWTTVTTMAGADYPVVAALARSGACGAWAVGGTSLGTGNSRTLAARLTLPNQAALLPRAACQGAPPWTTLQLDRLPRLGDVVAFAWNDVVGNSGLNPGSTLGLLGVSLPIGGPGTCGITVPGFGGASASGELLLAPAAMVTWLAPGTWNGPSVPFTTALAMPSASSLNGASLTAQALLVDVAGPLRGFFTAAQDLRLGQ